MNLSLVILLVAAGVMLMLVEIFLLPGISLAGIAGALALVSGVVVAYWKLGVFAGNITLIASVVLLALAIYLFIRSKALDKMSLKTDIDSKVDLLGDTEVNIGDKALTITRLAPMGKVRIGKKEIEAKSESGFLDAGTEVEITAIEGNIVNVKI